MQPKFQPLGFDYKRQELKHDLLESSEQLQNIEITKTMIYKTMLVFTHINYHMQHFFVPTQTQINLFEHKQLSNKFNNKTREYNLTEKN